MPERFESMTLSSRRSVLTQVRNLRSFANRIIGTTNDLMVFGGQTFPRKRESGAVPATSTRVNSDTPPNL